MVKYEMQYLLIYYYTTHILFMFRHSLIWTGFIIASSQWMRRQPVYINDLAYYPGHAGKLFEYNAEYEHPSEFLYVAFT